MSARGEFSVSYRKTGQDSWVAELRSPGLTSLTRYFKGEGGAKRCAAAWHTALLGVPMNGAVSELTEERVQAIITERLLVFEALLVREGRIQRGYPPEPPRTDAPTSECPTVTTPPGEVRE